MHYLGLFLILFWSMYGLSQFILLMKPGSKYDLGGWVIECLLISGFIVLGVYLL